MRILVVGSSGFIGRSVLRELIRRGHDVTGSAVNSEADIRLDVTDLASCRRVLADGYFDAVLNLSARGVTSGSADNRVLRGTNAQGPANFALAISEMANAPWLVHVASSTEPVAGEIAESIYSATKAQGTLAVRARMTQAQLPYSIARVHNTYGISQPPGRFLYDLVMHLRRGERVLLHYPNRVRDFAYIDDVVTHLADIVESPLSETADYEIGTGVGMSLRDVANLVCSRLGTDSNLVECNEPPEFDPQLIHIADSGSPCFRACATSLSDGIEKTLAGSA
jgi:nucleoside-diphosphate-sugar epimerase